MFSCDPPPRTQLTHSEQSDKIVALDDKALATGKIDPIKKGDALDFYSQGREGPHRRLGDNYPAGGIGAFAYSCWT